MNDRDAFPGGVPVGIVTGAANGMGRATTERLLASGWKIVAADRDVARLRWTDGLSGILPVEADVASREDNANLVRLSIETFGRLDAVVLNAGVSYALPVEQMEPEQLDTLLGVNLRGPFFGIQAALPALRQSPYPSVVVVSSTNGLGGDNSMSGYTASKFGVVGLVKALAREIAKDGVRINAVCPGATRTGMTIPLEEAQPDVYQRVANNVPLGRWAEPDEIAAVIEFLIMPGSSYVNGVALPVDGGASCGVGLHPPARSDDDLRSFVFHRDATA
jgi:meso-butanediol dehydrogenase/(S,S)-butanediol dehydrogenase/diacetyl reductase